jgi:hypothetical protein
MHLLTEGTPFPMMRYIISNPTYQITMAALMAGVMVAAMMLLMR